MGTTQRALLAFAALALLPACDGGDDTTITYGVPASVAPGTCVALSGVTLVTFSPSAPGTILDSVPVVGIDPAFTLVGIDFRPATRQLYGMAINTSSGLTWRLYAINPVTGFAVLTGVSGVGLAGFTAGALCGVDFNPVADRLRVNNTSNENARFNPNTGLLAANDTDLTFTGPAVGPVTACAYSNNVAGAATSTLYAVDRGASHLAMIGGLGGTPTPNGGVVTSVGALGVTLDGASDACLDITPGGTGYAVLVVGGSTGLYTINLATGAATLVGTIGGGALPITGLAVAP